MADQQQLLEEFVSVTGSDAERAQFYLEAAGWQLHIALSSFYDEDGGGQDDAVDVDGDSLVETTSAPVTSSSRQPSQPESASSTSGRFATISSLHNDESDSSGSNEDEGQAFYAGGSETSGQQILGPSKRKNKPDGIAQKIFDAAKRQGAEPTDNDSEARKPKQRQAFVGAGFRLGSEAVASEQITPSIQQSADTSRGPVTIHLKFWSNGFSIDEGPLRSFDDPANRALLNSIEKGEIPRELVPAGRGQEVHVNIEDHRHEEYVKPKLKVPVFSGKGQMLGSPAPQVVSNSLEPTSTTSSAPPKQMTVDDTKPVTTLQIRLADGTRSQPGASDNFILMTAFPNKELTEESKTLAEANLLNAVIIQKRR
eukprot:gene12683-3396_t